MRWRVEVAPGSQPNETDWRAITSPGWSPQAPAAFAWFRSTVETFGDVLSVRLMLGDRRIVRVSPGGSS